MMQTLRKLWNDDDGAVITTEFLLIVSILFFGLIPALVGFRNQLAATLLTAGNLIYAGVTNTAYDGYQIGGNTPGTNDPIASTAGYDPIGTTNSLVITSGNQNATTDATLITGIAITVTPAP